MPDTRDFLVKILVRMSVSVSWNAALTEFLIGFVQIQIWGGTKMDCFLELITLRWLMAERCV